MLSFIERKILVTPKWSFSLPVAMGTNMFVFLVLEDSFGMTAHENM